MSAHKFAPPETMTDDFGHECTEVRVLPYGGGGNILCGHRGYCREIAGRIERNRELAPNCRYDLPAWESLKVYFPEDGK